MNFKLHIKSEYFRRNAFLLLILLASVTAHASVMPYTTKDNSHGFWTDPATWEDSIMPGTSIVGMYVDCYGDVISQSCIDINKGAIRVHDTLIINGNLDLKNNAILEIDSSGILIVFGDYQSFDNTEVTNNGIIIVRGNFRMLGADSKGFYSAPNGKIFILDDTPEIKQGEFYVDLECVNPELPDSCGFGGSIELKKEPIFAYYSSLPYSKRNFLEDKNPCFEISLFVDKPNVCLYDTVNYILSTIGIIQTDTIEFEFGKDASYINTIDGVIQVVYSASGNQSALVKIKGNTNFEQEFPDLTMVFDDPITSSVMSLDAVISNGSYLEEICEGDIRKYSVESTLGSKYLWVIPKLDFEKMTGSEINVSWNIDSGEYMIYVQEISDIGCIGSISEAEVQIKSCIPVTPVSKKEDNYAFTPNEDGYNETWVIEGIDLFPLAKIYVYDRTGKLVFFSEGEYQNDWDGTFNGKKLLVDSYFYVIDFRLYNKDMKKGIVTIVR